MAMDERRVIRLEEVCALVGLARSTVYAKVSAGSFPTPIRLGTRSVGWRLSDLDRWLAAPERAWNPEDVR